MLRFSWYLSAITLALFTACSSFARVIYVNQAQIGPVQDGTSWVTAFLHAQDGVAASAPGDEVWVATGVYAGSFTLPAGVSLYGGFAGTEHTRDGRDPVHNATVLDGRNAQTGINGLTLVTVAGAAGPETVLDGFTLRNATAAITLPGSSPTISGNLLIAVTTGVSAVASHAVVQNNTFRDLDNGIAAANASFLTVRGNTFAACTGTAVSFQDGSSGPIEVNTFSDCAPSVISLRGGTTDIIGNSITHNIGGLRNVDTNSSVVYAYLTKVTITGNTINGNSGGIYLSYCQTAVRNNHITANRGGLLLENTTGDVANNIINANGASLGAGINCFNSNPLIVNNTITQNASGEGGAVNCTSSDPALVNNIIAFNTAGISLKPNPYTGTPSRPALRNNDVYGNTDGDYLDIPDPTGTSGNIQSDPRFRSPFQGDMHLQPDSPCVNAGDTSVAIGPTDIDGQPRIQGRVVDIGADESDGSGGAPQPFIVRVSPAGDDANDGVSWAHAKRSVRAAMQALYEHGGEAWVAAGVYRGTVAIPAYATFYGGFTGTETFREQRDPRRHATVLDGGEAGPVVYAGAASGGLDGFTIQNGGNGSLYDSYGFFTGGIYLDHTTAGIRNNVISGNYGGIYVAGGAPAIEENVIRANGGSYGGLTVYSANGARVASNTFTGNALSSSANYYSASALYAQDSRITIAGNTVVDNGYVASSIGYTRPVFQLASVRAGSVISNNLVAFNAAGLSVTSAGAILVRNNCVFGNAIYNYTGIQDQTGKHGNIKTDPNILRVPAGQIHLQPDSPCRDAGNDADVLPGDTDIDGQPRILDAHVDMGSDESDGTIWVMAPVNVRVTPAGSDARDGRSWSTAKRTVQAGIDAVAATGGSVWVAAGVYQERVTLGPATALYGGFSGTESAAEERNWRASPTVLDGSLGGTVVTLLPGAQGTIIDGFVIRNGLAQGGPTSNLSGGGIVCGIQSVFTIAHNVLLRNQASGGGGISMVGATGVIADNVFMGNVATGYNGNGGALSCTDSSPQLVNNVFAGNSAGYGGGAYLTGGAPILANNTFLGNSATAPLGSVASASGGAVYVTNSGALFGNNIFAYNSSGVAVDYSSPGSVEFVNNCVWMNARGDYVNYTDPTELNGNIRTDPHFLNPGIGDVRISAASPCRDAGEDGLVLPGDTDLDGEPRIQGTHVDIGADEVGANPVPVPATVIRVSPSGSDAADGRSWATAKRTVQGALNAFVGGGEVWVAAGTYAETLLAGPFISLNGGFAGTESERGGADPALRPTILDGQRRGPVVTIFGGWYPQTVDGLTIRNGIAPMNYYTPAGAGISALGAAVAVSNSVVTANAGIGMVVGPGSLVLNNVVSGSSGSGVYAAPGSRVTGNEVTGNTGLGIEAASGAIVTYNRVTHNGTTDAATNTSGGIQVGTSNQYFPNYGSSIVTNNVVTGNMARYGAAGVRAFGAVTVTNNLIVGNTSAGGPGGVSCNVPYDLTGPSPNFSVLVANNTISGNSGSGYGIGLSCSYAVAPIIRDNLIANNADSSSIYGSAGGGMYVPSNAIVTNNTIYGNVVSGDGGGIWASSYSYDQPLIANNILVGNSSGIYVAGTSPTVLRNNDVFGNTGYNCSGSAAPDAGSLSADPRFASPATGDFHLTSGSPCIDSGDDGVVGVSETDIDGQQRIQGRRVDMGADESPFVRAPYNVGDAAVALRLAAGLATITPSDAAFLNRERSGLSGARVDLLDAVRLLRKALGMDANP